MYVLESVENYLKDNRGVSEGGAGGNYPHPHFFSVLTESPAAVPHSITTCPPQLGSHLRP